MPLEALETEYDIEVEWKGLEIHPELPPAGMPREARFPPERLQQIEENVQQLAASVGLAMSFPPVISSSHLALEAAEFARDAGCHASFHRRLFEVYFQDGANIGDAGLLTKLAGEAGLDGAELNRALAEGRYDDRLAEATREAQRLGLNGVPTFIVGGRRVVGAQSYEVLRQAITLAGARPRRG